MKNVKKKKGLSRVLVETQFRGPKIALLSWNKKKKKKLTSRLCFRNVRVLL